MSAATPQHNIDHKVPVHVYEWKAWSNFLFPSLYTNAIRIEAKIRQSNSNILKKIPGNAGYFLFHINLTKTLHFFKDKNDLVTQLKSRGITPLNAEINDSSKKYVQHICQQTGLNTTAASEEGDENELLIIKTNFNYGGVQEKKLFRLNSWRLKLNAGDYSTDIMYPVMERKKIKKEVWRNENLAVEKYINNQGNYIYRVYKVLNKIVITENVEDAVIKKMRVVSQKNNYYYDINNEDIQGDDVMFADLLADIKKFSSALNLDFAAIDVVKSDDNKYYIIDLNLTPNWNRTDQPEKLSFLAEGINLENVSRVNTHCCVSP